LGFYLCRSYSRLFIVCSTCAVAQSGPFSSSCPPVSFYMSESWLHFPRSTPSYKLSPYSLPPTSSPPLFILLRSTDGPSDFSPGRNSRRKYALVVLSDRAPLPPSCLSALLLLLREFCTMFRDTIQRESRRMNTFYSSMRPCSPRFPTSFCSSSFQVSP